MGNLCAQREWIQAELERCIQFWLAHGWDKENGGVYTCLDRTGKVYSTDKSVWMQGRCAWTYAHLCNVYGVNREWLRLSKSCLDFLEACCINREKGNRMYFTVTAEGKPLRQRRYCFSECFYTIANAEYAAAASDAVCMQKARETYEQIWRLTHNLMNDPVGMPPKTIPETRQSRSLSNPMIYLNICSVMRRCDPENAARYEERARLCVDEIVNYHFNKDLRCTLENVGPNGEVRGDVTEGRIVNPGHDIECSWFLMEYADTTGDGDLHRTAETIFTYAIEAGWDKEYGGLLYFIDCEGMPPEAYEHDMKLWWPHDEILIASLMAYRDTGNAYYDRWFTKTLDYCREYFSDPVYGEWYGYLRRDGSPTMPSTKGSTFKGPFHLPRMLIAVETMLGKLMEKSG